MVDQLVRNGCSDLVLDWDRFYLIEERCDCYNWDHLLLLYNPLLSSMRPLVKTFNTIKGPKALGPYSTATIYNGLMYISGQLGISPETSELVSEDVQEQTKRCLDNMAIVLQ